ncbi:glycosyltransferase family 4 protein [candidate division WOR-3 bacterium]|nr:glycosyltransferase family 4 protein [candidate division WOR-3 bacterium]
MKKEGGTETRQIIKLWGHRNMDIRESIGKAKRVVLIKTSILDLDFRMTKELDTLKHGGYAVTLLCWDRDCKAPSQKQKKVEEDYNEIRLRFKAPYGVKILAFLPLWWCFVFFKLMVARWDIAHAINFDSIVPAAIAGKLRRKPVIYEIEDTYEDMVGLPKPIRYLCVQVDKLFIRLSSAVVIIDEGQIEELCGIPNHRIVTVYDPPADIFGKVDISSHKNLAFTLFYDGIFFKRRRLMLDKIFAAIKSIEDVEIAITGYGDQVEEIKEWCRKMPNKMEVLGWVSYDEVLRRSLEADLLFAIRNPAVYTHRYNCGSKLLKAMMCGKPVLANRGTSAADKVAKENCGLVIDANNIEEIKNAIVKLKDDPELCEELGANSRKAYEERYSFEIMERRLITLYQELNDEIGQENKKA